MCRPALGAGGGLGGGLGGTSQHAPVHPALHVQLVGLGWLAVPLA